MSSPAPFDTCSSFLLRDGAFRGRFVRLGPAIDTILTQHDYPPAVSHLLAETVALAVALANTMKFDGVFTLQAKGSGPVSALVADVTSQGAVRGYARFNEDQREALSQAGDSASVQRLLGAGHLAFTVDQGTDAKGEQLRYQGIIGLEGATLGDCVHQYFRQSEQLETAVSVAVTAPTGDHIGWQAGAMVLQRMPLADPSASEETEDDWRTAVVLFSSVTPEELASSALQVETVLYRLFHTQGVGVLATAPLRFGCRCSREKVEAVLATFSEDDLAHMHNDEGVIEAVCEFCGARYTF